MMSFIPVFPLNIIVFPDEPLNLHIFEPRYKQLIKECIKDVKPFGMPVVLDGKVQEYGTSVQVVELVKEYENGEMDIKVKGDKVFRVLEFVKQLPDRLYSGAIVSYPDNATEPEDSKLGNLIIAEVKRMYTLLNAEEKLPETNGVILSYKIAHFSGMNELQEYELLQLFSETQRLEYLRKHFNTIIPLMNSLEQIKARIQMNGHFRDLSLGDLEL